MQSKSGPRVPAPHPNVLRDLRESARLTIAELAYKADLSQRAIDKLLAGTQKTVARETLARLSRALGTSIEALLLTAATASPSRASPVPTPDQIAFRYLHHVEGFLGRPDESNWQWFRREGPRATDIHHGCVHIPDLVLSRLANDLLACPFLLLEGQAASGKSVLARLLAYQLWQDHGISVYFVYPNRIIPADLAAEIKHVQGVIIIEDLHLDIASHFELYSLLRTDPENRHVLWTTRTSFRKELPRTATALTDLPCFPADGNLVAWQITHMHLSLQSRLDDAARAEIGEQLRSRSDGNLWLLAYALEGYAEQRDNGSFADWVRAGVRSDLKALDLRNPELPGLVVSLSCLYQHEIPTAERYLTEVLGFSRETLTAAVHDGSITRTERNDEFFYGLHHSVPAEMYWRHAGPYRTAGTPSTCQDFIANYAEHRQSNAALALLSIDEPLSGEAIRLAQDKGFLSWVLLSGATLYGLARLFVRCSRPLNEHQRQVLHTAFERADASTIGRYLWYLRNLPEGTFSYTLDPAVLAAKIVQEPDVSFPLLEMRAGNTTNWQALANHVDWHGLTRAMETAPLHVALTCLACLYQIDGQRVDDLWRHLERQGFIVRYATVPPFYFLQGVCKAADSAPRLANYVCERVDFHRFILQCLYRPRDPLLRLSDASLDAGLRRVRHRRDCMRMNRLIRGFCGLSQAGVELLRRGKRAHSTPRGGIVAQSDAATESSFYGFAATYKDCSIQIRRATRPLRGLSCLPLFTAFHESAWTYGNAEDMDADALTEESETSLRAVYQPWLSESDTQLLWETLEGKRSAYSEQGTYISAGTLPFRITEYDWSNCNETGPCKLVCNLPISTLVDKLSDVSTVVDACRIWSWIRSVSDSATQDAIAQDINIREVARALVQACNAQDILDLWYCRALRITEQTNLVDLFGLQALADLLDERTMNRDAAKELAILLAMRHQHLAEAVLAYLNRDDVRNEILYTLYGGDTDTPTAYPFVPW